MRRRPQGRSRRRSAVYYAVKDAREAARAAERAGANAHWRRRRRRKAADVGTPDWRLVVRLASDALDDKVEGPVDRRVAGGRA